MKLGSQPLTAFFSRSFSSSRIILLLCAGYCRLGRKIDEDLQELICPRARHTLLIALKLLIIFSLYLQIKQTHISQAQSDNKIRFTAFSRWRGRMILTMHNKYNNYIGRCKTNNDIWKLAADAASQVVPIPIKAFHKSYL